MKLESLEVTSSLGLFFESTLGDVSVYLGLTASLVQVLIRSGGRAKTIDC